MAMRWHDTDKWNDDWYLGLEPELKCAWDYLTSQCNGMGVVKVSFQRMSSAIRGRPVDRKWIDENFGDRIIWIDADRVWIIGYIKFAYKALFKKEQAGQPVKNWAQLNTIRMAIRVASEIDISHNQKAVDLINYLSDLDSASIEAKSNINRGSDESRTGLERDSLESQPSLNRKRKKDKGKDLREGGVGEEIPEWPRGEFPIHPEFQGHEILDPVMSLISETTQAVFVRDYPDMPWLRENLTTAILYHHEEGADWGALGGRLVTWLPRQRGRPRRKFAYQGAGVETPEFDETTDLWGKPLNAGGSR